MKKILVAVLLLAQTTTAQNWSTTGNAGLSSSTHFIGTTDAVPLVFKVGNQRSGLIDFTANNTSFGYNSLPALTTGRENTGLGALALWQNTTGSYNTSVGIATMLYNTTGSHNTAVGQAALLFNTNGQQNNAYGASSLVMNNTGNYNNAFGQSALANNNAGTGNVAMGHEALIYNYSGSYNVAIGYGSGNQYDYLNNNISINNTGLLHGWHNQAIIGNQSHYWIGGFVGWSTFSDARIKTHIAEKVKGLDFIMKLRPVTYHRSIDAVTDISGGKRMPDYAQKYDAEEIEITGFIAQEVERAAKESGYDFSGVSKPRTEKELYSLSYESFVVPLVKAMQEQQAMIEELKREIIALKKDNGGFFPRADSKPNPYSVTPNPGNEFTTLNFSNAADQPLLMMLYDGTGKLVWKQRPTSSANIKIPLRQFSSGTYILSIVNETGQYNLKLVKQ